MSVMRRGRVASVHGPSLLAVFGFLALALSLGPAIAVAGGRPAGVQSRDALVRVVVRLTNASAHPRSLVNYCNDYNPWVEILGPRGNVAYSPHQREVFHPVCHASISPALRLRPRATIRSTMFVVMRGRYVRPVAQLESGTRLLGATRHVRLKSAQPPRLLLHSTPPVYVDVLPPRPEPASALYYSDEYRCPPMVVAFSPGHRWTRASSRRIAPPCPHPSYWRIMVAWLNNPVAEASYGRRYAGSPTE